MAAHFTDADLDRFIEAVASNGANVSKACIEAGVGRPAIYARRDADPDFAARWAAAVERGSDALEDEAVRRAIDGVEEPVFYKGDVVGHVTKYSDGLLVTMLKARRPEKFKERSETALTGKDGGPIATAALPSDPVEAARAYQRLVSGA